MGPAARGGTSTGRRVRQLGPLRWPTPFAFLGAVAAEVYGHPSEDLTMIGITGTNGKTTTAYLIESALRAHGQRTGLIGTVETRIGKERLDSVRTTPEAPELHAVLAVMA